jgi:hypothetical protein
LKNMRIKEMLHCKMIIVFDVCVLSDVSCKEVLLAAMLYMLPSTLTICTAVLLPSSLMRISCHRTTTHLAGYNMWKKVFYA